MFLVRRCLGKLCHSCCSGCCTCCYCCCAPVMGTTSDSDDDEPNATKLLDVRESGEGTVDVIRGGPVLDFQKPSLPTEGVALPVSGIGSKAGSLSVMPCADHAAQGAPGGLGAPQEDVSVTNRVGGSWQHAVNEVPEVDAPTAASTVAEPSGNSVRVPQAGSTVSDRGVGSHVESGTTGPPASVKLQLSNMADKAMTPISNLVQHGRVRLRQASRRGAWKARQMRRAIRKAAGPFIIPLTASLPRNYTPPPVGVAGVAATAIHGPDTVNDIHSLLSEHHNRSITHARDTSITSNNSFHTIAENFPLAHTVTHTHTQQPTSSTSPPQQRSLATNSLPLPGSFGGHHGCYAKPIPRYSTVSAVGRRGGLLPSFTPFAAPHPAGQSPRAEDLSRHSTASAASSYFSVASEDVLRRRISSGDGVHGPGGLSSGLLPTRLVGTFPRDSFASPRSHTVHSDEHPALSAFKRNRLGFGFSGGGFLFPYHLGVVIELMDAGIINSGTQLAGASCGSIIVACCSGGLDMHAIVDKLLEFADDCRTKGTAGRLRFVIEHFMGKELPADAHVRCSSQAHIQLTRVLPFIKMVTVSEFSSKEDLVKCIATSCHIPAFNDGLSERPQTPLTWLF